MQQGYRITNKLKDIDTKKLGSKWKLAFAEKGSLIGRKSVKAAGIVEKR